MLLCAGVRAGDAGPTAGKGLSADHADLAVFCSFSLAIRVLVFVISPIVSFLGANFLPDCGLRAVWAVHLPPAGYGIGSSATGADVNAPYRTGRFAASLIFQVTGASPLRTALRAVPCTRPARKLRPTRPANALADYTLPLCGNGAVRAEVYPCGLRLELLSAALTPFDPHLMLKRPTASAIIWRT